MFDTPEKSGGNDPFTVMVKRNGKSIGEAKLELGIRNNVTIKKMFFSSRMEYSFDYICSPFYNSLAAFHCMCTLDNDTEL